MGKPKARSILYRLIEAGQLTRATLLVPLLERGLEPGDDAVLFLLHDEAGATEPDLAAELGLDEAAFAARIARLIERDLVERRPADDELPESLALTERGDRIRLLLGTSWTELEQALLGELPKKRHKELRKTLERFIELLRS